KPCPPGHLRRRKTARTNGFPEPFPERLAQLHLTIGCLLHGKMHTLIAMNCAPSVDVHAGHGIMFDCTLCMDCMCINMHERTDRQYLRAASGQWRAPRRTPERLPEK